MEIAFITQYHYSHFLDAFILANLRIFFKTESRKFARVSTSMAETTRPPAVNHHRQLQTVQNYPLGGGGGGIGVVSNDHETTTLLIRHLPEAIPQETLSRLFSHYGASSVRPCFHGRFALIFLKTLILFISFLMILIISHSNCSFSFLGLLKSWIYFIMLL